MKKHSIFLLLFVVLYSCQQKKQKSAEDSLTKKTVSAGINVNTATIKKIFAIVVFLFLLCCVLEKKKEIISF